VLATSELSVFGFQKKCQNLNGPVAIESRLDELFAFVKQDSDFGGLARERV
jgi:hypothetical protein